MLIDFESLLLDPVYLTTGSTAVLTDKGGQSLPVSVLDHRDGIDLVTAKGGAINVPGVSAEEAVAYVRQSECPQRPIGWRLAFEGDPQAYEVKNAKQKGRPGNGEWVLVLQRA